MSLSCTATGSAVSLLQDLAGYADCSAQALGRSGFGGALPAGVLAACLTIYVALIGYRLLLGEVFDARAIVIAAARIGLVVTLCLSWSSFETLFYRVVIDAPAEIAGGALNGGGSGASMDAIAARAQQDYQIAQFGHQTPPTADGTLQPAPTNTKDPNTPQPRPNNPILSQPGLTFFLSVAAGLIAIRLVAGLLLAIGPLVLALGLFDSALGLVEGWLRGLTAATLGTTGLLVTTLLELDFVEAQLALPAPDTLSGQGLMLTGAVFIVVSVTMTIAAIVAARGVRLPLRSAVLAHTGANVSSGGRQSDPRPLRQRQEVIGQPPDTMSRAQSIADAIATQARRERSGFEAVPEPGPGARRVGAGGGVQHGGSDEAGRSTPLGHSLRRTPQAGRSASVKRREGRQ